MFKVVATSLRQEQVYVLSVFGYITYRHAGSKHCIAMAESLATGRIEYWYTGVL